MALEKGSLLNKRYRIDDTIAAGGMGAVYRATDETLGISVAVKENFFSTDESSRQFRREATILASLRHPNLPRVTDHFVIPNQGQYLVMDFIEGSDLRDLLGRAGALPQEDIVRIGVVISGALAYLHSRNPVIVHRDIKPGNIKVTPNGGVFLVDFGLAKLGFTEATMTGAQGLTPGYAPPEQYGQGTEPRSDIYSLGATLYAGLTGKVPEDGLSRAMGTADLTPIRKYNSAVSERLARVIERAMAVTPGERYATAEDLKNALSSAAPAPAEDAPLTVIERRLVTQGREKAAPPPPVIERKEDAYTIREKRPAAGGEAAPVDAGPRRDALPVEKTRRRFPTGAFLGIGGLVVIAAAAGILYAAGMIPLPARQALPSPTASLAVAALPTSTITSTPPPTETSAPTATQQPTQAPTATLEPAATEVPLPTATPTLSVTPVGGGLGEIAFASDRTGSVQVWIMGSDGSNARQITNLGDGACQPDWSPDGQRLVFISPCSDKKEDYPGASMFLINADGTGLFPLASMPGGDFDPAWSPDGAQIAFTSLRDSGWPHIFLYNLADNKVKRLSSQTTRDRQAAWSPDGSRIAYGTTRLGNPQIWTMAVDGSGAHEFSKLEGSYEFSPAWAPDNSMIIYSQGNSPMLIARPWGSGTAAEFTISDTIRPVDEARFSKDGWWLAFTDKVDNNFDIYIMKWNAASLTRLTTSPGLDFHPSWRP